MAQATAAQALAENVSVAVRIRPLNAKELGDGDTQIWKVPSGARGQIHLMDDKATDAAKSTFAYGGCRVGAGSG